MKEGLNLTKREAELLVHLLKGISNKEIAAAMGLQVVTVKMHLRSICRKFGVKNRTQAALKASGFFNPASSFALPLSSRE